jgi:DNA-binding response OmpR family regulator
MHSILTIEDDRAVQRALKHFFEAEGYTVECRYDGPTGLDAFRAIPPAVVILDLRLPGMTGMEVCREIKQASPNLPVIVLSASTEIADKVLLLELGADDYVTKPFSPRELLARIHVAMRNVTHAVTTTEAFSFDDITVDFTRMEVKRSGCPIACTPQELKILKFFSENLERVVSRDELLNRVWGYDGYDGTRTVDNHIMKLRQKIERNPASPIHFRTVYGVGYKFEK